VYQPFQGRLWSRRGCFFLFLLCLISSGIALMVVRRQLAAYLGLQLPELQTISDVVTSLSDSFALTSATATSYPLIIVKAWSQGLLALGVSAVSGLALLWLALRRIQTRDEHGTARWATRKDVIEAGLLEVDAQAHPHSLIVGGWQDPDARAHDPPEYLVHTGPESLTVFAGSGSGKTAALVVPNLLCYESSAFVLDIKGELWESTAGYRKEELRQIVMFHDPSSENDRGARFNPLDEVDITSISAVRDVQMIAEYLVPNKGDEENANAHFVDAARSLTVGVILYELALSYEKDKQSTNIASVLSRITSPNQSFSDYLSDMQIFDQSSESVVRVIREIATEMKAKESKEFSGVLSSMTTPLSKFRDPILARATEASDFRIRDLMDQKSGVTLYLTVRPRERDRLADYFALVVNLLFRELTNEKIDASVYRRKVLMSLDEFTSLPPLPVVSQSMDIMRSYGLKAFIVVQDIESINNLYGDHETFSSNSKVRVAYTPAKLKTAELLSSMTGTATVTDKTVNHQRKNLDVVATSSTESEGIHQRPLMTVDEVMRMKIAKLDANDRMIEAGESLVFVKGCPPIKAIQTPYFFDDELLRRSKIPPPERSERIVRASSKPGTHPDRPRQIEDPTKGRVSVPVAEVVNG